jgi:diguanylate cyclase (GGDEF)-like protein
VFASAERLAATGLAFAALTIVALALLARFELDREVTLHRDVIAAVQVKDSLEALRTQLNELRSAARLASVSRDPQALQAIERRAVEIDAELRYLEEQAGVGTPGEAFASLSHSARLLAVNARSVVQGGSAAGTDGAELDRLAAQASTSLDRMLDAQRRRLNDGTLAQIRVGETLRGYVSWLLAGSITVLLGLSGFYRWAKVREARALRRIEQLAHYDTVTGLPNRTLLTDRLEQEVARAKRATATFAVLTYDLDGFKAVNDTYGHAAGDRVLALVGERSRSVMRASDTVGRLGGDEFLAILPGASVEGATIAAEKLREALRQPYAVGGATARVSASIGASFFPADGEDAEALRKAADDALYEAKRAGKNRLVIARGAARVPENAAG